jgi:hypothetical protein
MEEEDDIDRIEAITTASIVTSDALDYLDDDAKVNFLVALVFEAMDKCADAAKFADEIAKGVKGLAPGRPGAQLSPMEAAAEQVSEIFDALREEDRFACHVRLLAVGALNAGDLDFVEAVAGAAREAVLEVIRRPKSVN